MGTQKTGFDTPQFISFAKSQMGGLEKSGTLACEFKSQTEGSQPNFWQIGCVFDTILDYFLALKEAGELEESDKVLMKQLVAQAVRGYQYGIVTLEAAWYDDWSWWGIAASKAFDADYEDVFGDQLQFFRTAAMDLWGLVDAGDYAPLADRIPASIWAKSATTEEGIKFTKKILKERSRVHTGTPNAWDLILRGKNGKATGRQKSDYLYFNSEDPQKWTRPRFPGGCWQYDLSTLPFASGDGPGWQNPNPQHQKLGFFQVTLMSGLYLSFVCSLIKAAKRKAAESKSGDGWDRLKSYTTYQESARKVVGFLSDWFQVKGRDSLVKAFTKGSLVHERTPTYDRLDNGVYPKVQGYWPTAYWGGDQGLVMGALKQYSHFVSRPPHARDETAKPIFVTCPMELLTGVFYRMKTAKLENAVGPYLDSSGRSPLTWDDGDYGSGSGIFWRYVLRCCRLDPSFKAEAGADPRVVRKARTSGTHVNNWGNSLFQPFNTVAAAIGAWYLLK